MNVKKKYRFSLRKFKVGLGSVILGTTLIGLVTPAMASDSSNNVELENYKNGFKAVNHDLASLTPDQASQIIKVLPDLANIDCGDVVHFVFEKDGKVIVTDNPPKTEGTIISTEVQEKNPQIEKVAENAVKTLPNTGAEAFKGAAFIGFITLGAGLYLLYRNRKNAKIMVIALTLGGLGFGATAQAANLNFDVVYKQNKLEFTAPTIEGYTYVGYWVEDGVCELPVTVGFELPNGETIKPSILVPSSEVNSKIPETFTHEGKIYRRVAIKNLTSSKPIGVYEEIKITFKFQDEIGNSIDKDEANNSNKYKFIREDKNNNTNTITKVYHKITTSYVDDKGNSIEPTPTDGKVEKHKDIDGYTFDKTEKLPNGDIIHKYIKNPTIIHQDEMGENIDKDNAENPDKYVLLREDFDKDSNTITKSYHKIVTKYKDDTDKVIETVEGKEIAPKVIDGYTHTNTTVEDNGDVVHTYKKIPKNSTVTYIDEQGSHVDKVNAEDPYKYKVISEKEKENGDIEKTVHKIVTKYVNNKTGNAIEEIDSKVDKHKEIDGYTYMTTEILDNGDIVHKYSKNPTIVYVDEENRSITEIEANNPDLYTFVEDREDNNPDTETKVYHKIVTKYVNNNNPETEIKEKVDGKNNEKPVIEGYTYSTTETKDNGDIVHKYNKVPVISYIDEQGAPVDKVNAEDPNKYTVTSQKNKDNGDIEKTVHKIVTKYENNKDNSTIEQEDGKVEIHKEIEGYTYVSTETKDNGDIVHKYSKNPTISYIDESGSPLLPEEAINTNKYKLLSETPDNENNTIVKRYHKIETMYVNEKTGAEIRNKVDGKSEDKPAIDGYTYVITETTDNGDIIHKYSKNPEIAYEDDLGSPITEGNATNTDLYKFVKDKVDSEANKITKVYHKIITRYVDNHDGTDIETTDGKVEDSKDIPNYTYVSTETDENGDIIHKYKKNPTIVYEDESTAPVNEEDAKDTNKYTYLREDFDEDSNTITKYYHKIVTKYVDNKNTETEIKNKVDGKSEDKPEIDGYTYVTTERLDNGDIVHKYNKIPVITYVDEKGVSVDKENAENPNKYKVISQKDKDNGDIEKTVHKIVTKYVDNKDEEKIQNETAGKLVDHPEIEGYKFVETINEQNGDVTHKYNKIPDDKYVTTTGDPLTKEVAEGGDYYKVREETDDNTGGKTYVYDKVLETLTDTRTVNRVINHITDNGGNDITNLVNEHANFNPDPDPNLHSSLKATLSVEYTRNKQTKEIIITSRESKFSGGVPYENLQNFEADGKQYTRKNIESDFDNNIIGDSLNITAEVVEGELVYRLNHKEFTPTVTETVIWTETPINSEEDGLEQEL